MRTHHLAQINVGRLRFPLEAPETAEFVAALDPINQLAEASPGFVWRLTGDDGSSSSYVAVTGRDDPLEIVNYSIWQDLDSLKHFMHKTDHLGFLRRRREWFEVPTVAIAACWWIPAGTIPEVDEAYERLEHLRANGSTPTAWALNQPVPPPSSPSPAEPSTTALPGG